MKCDDKNKAKRRGACIIRMIGSVIFMLIILIVLIVAFSGVPSFAKRNLGSSSSSASLYGANMASSISSSASSSLSSSRSSNYSSGYSSGYTETYSTVSSADMESAAWAIGLFFILIPLMVIYGLILVIGSILDFYWSCIYKRWWHELRDKHEDDVEDISSDKHKKKYHSNDNSPQKYRET